MLETLLVIDSYLSNLDRANVCENLISQLKEVFPSYKILLINKSKTNFGLEDKVDYYFNFSDSFMVGEPPQEFLDSGQYDRPYLYHKVSIGTIENWLPTVGVSDHVAGIYNSFILSSKLGKSLGFKKIFKIEYDIDFDMFDLYEIKKDVENFENYLLFGVRKEGDWTNKSYVDTHIIGYSPEIFIELDLVRNDDEYWQVCEKAGYYGKWIEYLIYGLIFRHNILGTIYEGSVRDMYPNTVFDKISSPSFWTEKWKKIPMIAKVSLDGGSTVVEDRVCLFYLNKDFDSLKVETSIHQEGNEIYSDTKELKNGWWVYDEVPVNNELTVNSEYLTNENEKYSYTQKITVQDIKKLTYRWIKN